MKKEYTCPHCGAPLWVTTEKNREPEVKYSCDCREYARKPPTSYPPAPNHITIIHPEPAPYVPCVPQAPPWLQPWDITFYPPQFTHTSGTGLCDEMVSAFGCHN